MNPVCCCCRERPAVIFGAFCMACYWSEPPAYLAACRVAREQGRPHPDDPPPPVVGAHARGWHDPEERERRLAGRPVGRGGITP